MQSRLASLLVGAALFCPASASAEAGLFTGFGDNALQYGLAAEREADLDRALEARAGAIRIFVSWSSVAPARPQAPRDPADPAYNFARIDDLVRSADARGLDVLLTVLDAPAWAEGSKRPQKVPAGTWKPGPADLGDFSAALAARYSGDFAGLPRVRWYQPWNEPNIEVYLAPQWVKGRLFAASHYRRMLNEAAAGIESVDRSNVVVSAGLAPYGDRVGRERSRPLRFWRELLCLNENLRRACRSRVNFDTFGVHAINTSGPPDESAIHPDDMSTADLAQAEKILRAAERTGSAKGRHPIWVTELWWESNPPDPSQGFPAAVQARHIEETLYLAWKAGARAAFALQIRDSLWTRATRFERDSTGVFFHDGSPKPALQAMRFPFVATALGGNQVKLWGKAPSSGRVIVEQRRGGNWRRIASVRAGGSLVFAETIRLRGRADLRARMDGEQSLVWKLK